MKIRNRCCLRPTCRPLQAPALFLLLIVLSAVLVFGAVPEAKGKKTEKPYALIFGTVWSPDNRPMYGIKVKIRPATSHKPKWELMSDHNGEFAQRVPPGPADYLVSADLKGTKSSTGKQLELEKEITVHIAGEERVDIGLHLKVRDNL